MFSGSTLKSITSLKKAVLRWFPSVGVGNVFGIFSMVAFTGVTTSTCSSLFLQPLYLNNDHSILLSYVY